MHVTCKCLNVSIRSRASELKRINVEDIELTTFELSDTFFRENIAMIPELEGITKEQPGLVEIRSVGSWVIHYCYNCSTNTHAVHREYGAAMVLINTKIIDLPLEVVYYLVGNLEWTYRSSHKHQHGFAPRLMSRLSYSQQRCILRRKGDLYLTIFLHSDPYVHCIEYHRDVMPPEKINELRANPDFSPVFRIVINHSALDDIDLLQPPTKFSVSQLSSNLQLALGGLQQQLEEAVQRQAIATEEKVRAFTAEQYQLLEEFRERTHNEHILLARLICNSEETGKSACNLETPPATPDNVKTSIAMPVSNKVTTKLHVVTSDTKLITGTDVRHQAAAKHPTNLHVNGSIDKTNSLKLFSKEPSSFDAEALFTLEGMDDILPSEQLQPSEEESDTDDSGHDEGIHIPRGQRGGHPTLAKSLPVSVPAFPSFARQALQDQNDDQLSRDPLDPHNIRASIKALAKSVHGDAVFGDLPRPRFSTQI